MINSFRGATRQTVQSLFFSKSRKSTRRIASYTSENTIEQRSDLGGALEQIMTYSLSVATANSMSSSGSETISFPLPDYSAEGIPVYSMPQPFSILDTAKSLLETGSL
jgi:hypothetical protein